MWWNFSFIALLLWLFHERLFGLIVSYLLLDKLKYDTRLKWLTIRPSLPGTNDFTEVTLYNFRILNPPQYKRPYFVKIRQLTLKFDAVTVFSAAMSGGSAAIQIDEILVNGVRVNMERHANGELNMSKILGASEEEAQKLLAEQQAVADADEGEGEGEGASGRSVETGAPDEEDEEDGEKQFRSWRQTGPLRRALGAEAREVRRARRKAKKAEKLEAEKNRLPYRLLVDRFFLLDAQVYIKDFLVSNICEASVLDAKPVKVKAFQLWGKRDFAPTDPDQDGLFVDEFIGRLVSKIISPVLQENKTALVSNLASAAVDSTKTQLKDGFMNVKVLGQGLAGGLAETVTNPLGSKRVDPNAKGCNNVSVSGDIKAMFGAGGAKLKVTLLRGDALAKRNPFVVMRLRHESTSDGTSSRIKVKSRVKVGQNSPEWAETFEMDPLSSWGDVLKIEVRHQKTTSGEEKIGGAELALACLKPPPHEQKVTLELSGEGSSGTITIATVVLPRV